MFVLDAYEGIEAKRFIDLTAGELTHYTDTNVAALAALIESFRPDAIITGHEVMGPYIARLACQRMGTEYVAKLHGSGLEYAVKLQQRYQRFASEGLMTARFVVGGSRYMIDAAAAVLPGWRERARVVNPGCDVDLFRPLGRRATAKPIVGYVGKLIASKGVDHLLAALPLLEEAIEVIIVGFGGDEKQLHLLWDALQAGDREGALAMAAGGDIGAHRTLRRFLEGVRGDYFERAAAIEVKWTGRLDHGPLSKVLPTFHLLVAPSVVAEAFGMVAAEAASCAVLPVVPRHSGIGEAGARLEERLDLPGLLTFDPADPISGIAGAVNRLLAMPESDRRAKGAAAARVARELWSWEVVADKLLELAC